MGIRKYIKKYKDYETKELASRAARKRKISAYKNLTKKKTKATFEGVKFKSNAYTRAIGNPYGTQFPKAKKILKKVRKRRVKKVIYYK